LETILGVPQSITLLNLLFIGSSSSVFLRALIGISFLLAFGKGANNYFFKSAILFCFSVITTPSFPIISIFYCFAAVTGAFYKNDISFNVVLVGLSLFRSLSLQNSSFHNSLTSIISILNILLQYQLFSKIT
jgi:hypothetical protein